MAGKPDCAFIKAYDCPVCGKRFYADSSIWAYQTYVRTSPNNKSRRPVCSWGCLRKAQSDKRNYRDVTGKKTLNKERMKFE